MKTSILLIFILSGIFCFGQTNKADTSETKLQYGAYGSYADYSIYTEITLNEDHTFKYIDHHDLYGSFTCIGKWKINKDKLILFDTDNVKNRPMPYKWKIKENMIIGERVHFPYGKFKIELDYQKKK